MITNGCHLFIAGMPKDLHFWKFPTHTTLEGSRRGLGTVPNTASACHSEQALGQAERKDCAYSWDHTHLTFPVAGTQDDISFH